MLPFKDSLGNTNGLVEVKAHGIKITKIKIIFFCHVQLLWEQEWTKQRVGFNEVSNSAKKVEQRMMTREGVCKEVITARERGI